MNKFSKDGKTKHFDSKIEGLVHSDEETVIKNIGEEESTYNIYN
jgi:hypothetical protein